MFHYWQGVPTRQAHKGIPEGQYEEEQGRDGFFGPVSHLIKKSPSTKWIEIDGPLKPHLYDLVLLKDLEQEKRLLYNNDVAISMKQVKQTDADKLYAYRNADGDEVLFCHSGKGTIYTEYGCLTYVRSQYICIPKCIAYVIDPDETSTFLKIESRTSRFIEPDRGIVGRHAVYDINALGRPELEGQQQLFAEKNISIKKIKVKHGDQFTSFGFSDCAFDVTGWKGDFFPFTLHTDHMMPLMSHRAHLPPSAHTTFVARNFVICTFLPRPLEEEKDALKVPFYHQNIDYDEVLFYHDGDFFSRDNLHAGMMTFHPAGFPHGPHPKAIEKIDQKTRTDEYAVMVDTRFPLYVDNNLETVEVMDYWKSWMK